MNNFESTRHHFLCILVGLLTMAGCNTLRNNLEEDVLNCGSDFQGGEYFVVTSPDGRRLNRENIKISSLNLMDVPAPKISSKGCIAERKDSKFLVSSNEHDWAAVYDSEIKLDRKILSLRDNGNDSLVVVCDAKSTVAVNRDFDVRDILNEHISSNLIDSYRVMFELVKRGQVAGVQFNYLLSELRQGKALFSLLNEEGLYDLKIRILNLSKNRESQTSVCSLNLDVSAPKVALAVNQKNPTNFLNYNELEHIALITPADNLSFSVEDVDGKEISYCYEFMDDDFNGSDSSKMNVWRNISSQKTCNALKTFTVEPNRPFATPERSGFWNILFKAKDKLGNETLFKNQIVLYVNLDSINFAKEIVANKLESLILANRNFEAAKVALETYRFSRSLKTRYEKKILSTAVFSGIAKVVNGSSMLLSLAGHSSDLTAAVFSSDSKILITASDDKTLKFWETSNGQLLKSIDIEQGYLTSLALDSKNNQVVSGGTNHRVRIWDIDSRAELLSLEGHFDPVYAVAIDSAARIIASISARGEIRIWDREKGSLLHILGSEPRIQGPWAYLSLAFSPDGNTLASISSDQVLSLWDVQNHKLIKTFPDSSAALTGPLGFSADGSKILTGSEMGVLVWSADADRFVSILKGTDSGMSSFAMSLDHSMVATSGKFGIIFNSFAMENSHYSNFWPAQSTFPNPSKIAISPDKRYLAIRPGLTQDRLQLGVAVNPLNRAKMQGSSDYFGYFGMSLDGKRIISVSNLLQIDEWDIESRSRLRKTDPDDILYRSVLKTPDDRFLIGGRSDGQIDFLNYSDRTLQFSLAAEQGEISFLALDPGEKNLIVVSEDKVSFWQLASRKHLFTISAKNESIMTLAFSSNGESLFLGHSRGLVTEWNLLSREKIGEFVGHVDSVTSMKLSKDGRLLFSASRDKTIKIWDLRLKKAIRTMSGHLEWVQSLDISNDESMIASAGKDGLVKFWSVDDGVNILTISDDKLAIQRVIFTKDGEGILLQEENGEIDSYTINVDSLATRLCSALQGFLSTELCPSL